MVLFENKNYYEKEPPVPHRLQYNFRAAVSAVMSYSVGDVTSTTTA